MRLKALVLTGYGINCEVETRNAIVKAGGDGDILHLSKVIEEPRILEDYNFLVFPGGFSFGDALGSGKVLSNKIKHKIYYPLLDFIKDGKLIMGVCNGFQALVKMGLLPNPEFKQTVSLIGNDSGKFEDRWVLLKINKKSNSIFTRGIDRIFLPIRHGDGKFIADKDRLKELWDKNQIVMQYIDGYGNTSAGYPYNPNGSIDNIAGITDKTGRILGLMPHPEAFHIIENCPYWPTGGIKEAQGLKIFKNAADYIESHR